MGESADLTGKIEAVFSVLVGMSNAGEVFARRSRGQLGVKDAFLPLKVVREGLNLPALAPDHDHLGAEVLVQVDMRRGQDLPAEMMLLVRQPLRQAAGMMIVDQGDRAQGLITRLPLLPHQVVSDQVADELRTVLVVGLADQLLQLVVQGLLDGHAESNEFGHG